MLYRVSLSVHTAVFQIKPNGYRFSEWCHKILEISLSIAIYHIIVLVYVRNTKTIPKTMSEL